MLVARSLNSGAVFEQLSILELLANQYAKPHCLVPIVGHVLPDERINADLQQLLRLALARWG
eukprot:16436897-Heterocapsa_arctica.AAC.1